MDGGRGGRRIEFRRRRAPTGDVDEPTAAPRSPSPPPWINSIQPDRSDLAATWPILVGFTWKARVEKRLESQAWARFKSFQRAACFDPLYI